MTELEQAKLTVEINHLEREADELKQSIQGNLNEAENIVKRNKVMELKNRALFLRSVKNGLVVESSSDLRKKITVMKIEIERLNKEIGKTYLKINDADYVESIIK